MSITTIYPPYEDWRMMFSIRGRGISRLEDVPSADFGVVDANYLRTAGIPVVEGREFSDSDRENTPPMAIVNQAFVKKYLPDEDPIGRQMELGAPASQVARDVWMGDQRIQVTIAGVMRDSKDDGLAQPVTPQLITLFRQTPPVNFGFKEVLVRSALAPEAVGHAVEQQLHAIDPRIPLSEVESMTDAIGEMTMVKRFTSVILACFAGLGLILATVGIYGVIAYLVAERTQEVGIRLALGSSRGAVLWLVARQGLGMALAGVGIGVVGVLLGGRSMASLLYNVSAMDLSTLVTASLLLVAMALVACMVPARRAATIDPVRALRAE
jgi:putative ABC transport system permease protein